METNIKKNYIYNSLYDGVGIDEIIIDFSKALVYDSVPHDRLLIKWWPWEWIRGYSFV
jgi:hypothetical protein